ncbi:radical SAM protein [bacterium (Candidatus Torokbacteria) CG_4_10_14_0_2_um_filter_35_8]|nr:MAG: radical SAM protein [bacterium (Candidatus Torokbacteria) CG_4_10_14_0_2_um_filter_35_8]
MKNRPSYLSLYKSGELQKRKNRLLKTLEKCTLCPRKCKVNRVKGEKGFCKAGLMPKVNTAQLHFGEEPPISGRKGSGTIFFSHCNMRCVYCQNFPISHLGYGEEVSSKKLAQMMLNLQSQKAHNINLVSPTHFVPQIIEALEIAILKGLKIPLVYNTNGFDSIKTLKLLDDIFDIYLPDMKYTDSKNSQKYSQTPNYFYYNKKAIGQMHRQVGNPVFTQNRVIKKGLIVRHLVLPNNISDSKKVFKFLASKISKKVYVSLMAQYYPTYKAEKYPKVSRRITKKEYEKTLKEFYKKGLKNGFIQSPTSATQEMTPNFHH